MQGAGVAMKYIMDLKDVKSNDINLVGGKNASIGEMIQGLSAKGVLVPGGFATTAEAYKRFLAENHLDTRIYRLLRSVNMKRVNELNKASKQIQRWIMTTAFSSEFENDIIRAYAKLKNTTVAVRSSATAEDLASASFAGAQETFLNVKGIKQLLLSIKRVYASLFTSRAIAYRNDQGFDHASVALSVGVQPMVRSDKGVSGVIFTLDTETGFDKVIVITSSYGLGEAIVQGKVNPDEFVVYKPALQANKLSILQRRLGDKTLKMIYARSKNLKSLIKTVPVKASDRTRFSLNDKDIQSLAHQAMMIEKHYGKPMDIEWAKDGLTGELVILQARPETVVSQQKQLADIEHYVLSRKGKILTTGQSVGQRIGSGTARVILDPKKIRDVKPGDILVTDMTDPDWEPIMKHAAAIVTNRGGRTCHAAIVARELGIPAIVGCVSATSQIKTGQIVTVSCAEGHKGFVYEGAIPFTINKIKIHDLPKLPVKLCLNVGNPEKAFATQFLPNDGVGLARLEFIISDIGIHPNAVLQYDKLPVKIKQEIHKKTAAYASPKEFYIEKLREGIAMIAAAFFPKEVIFRFSDFKTNEYANLLGGQIFEPKEENPMLGFRGASRYRDKKFIKCFELECIAFKRVREKMQLNNAQLMIPFVRTVDELQQVIKLIEENGLQRGKDNLKIYMMCEVPSNVLLAEQFLEYVDGFSIGSNDLTQLILGLDRDSSLVSDIFDERNDAVKAMLHHVINICNKQNKYIGICGQGPSDHPDFAKWLMQEGIQSMSLNPDTIIETWLSLGKIKDR